MSYFVASRPADSTFTEPTPRIGLTVGKVMGKAVDRNRIKRRMREAVRRNIATLEGPIDVVLHPRRSVIDLDFAALDREVAQVFSSIRKATRKQPQSESLPDAMPDPEPSLAARAIFRFYKSGLSPAFTRSARRSACTCRRARSTPTSLSHASAPSKAHGSPCAASRAATPSPKVASIPSPTAEPPGRSSHLS